jgi:hypothetical protein
VDGQGIQDLLRAAQASLAQVGERDVHALTVGRAPGSVNAPARAAESELDYTLPRDVMRPILIMSSERSGSNLVRRILAAHSAVAAPPPPHLWRVLAPVLPYYGPLSQERSWRELLADALALTQVENSHLRWKHALTEAEVLAQLTTKNLSGIAGALYSAYAAREGKQIWACKENNLFDHALRILDAWPQTKILYLARDGRDVACSIQKVPTHDQHVYFIAQEWRAEQLKCIDVYQEQSAGNRARLLRYEELLAAPERELRGLCEFLKLPFEPAMLEFHADPDSQSDAAKTQFWKNLDRPIMGDNKAKFLRELSPREIEIFEAVAGDVLELLGYPRCAGEKLRSIGDLDRWWFKLKNRHQRRRKFKKLFEEPGRREREQALRKVSRGRREGLRQPLAAPLSYAAAAAEAQVGRERGSVPHGAVRE